MDKLKKLMAMTEHPERYSDEEWEAVVGTADVTREEIDRQWMRLTGTHLSPHTSHPTPRKLTRWAAAIAALLMVSGLAWAAIHTLKTTESETATTEQTVTTTAETTNGAAPVTFENVPLEDILDEIARHYGATVSYHRDDVRTLRLYFTWNPNQPLDEVVDLFNHFEKFHLDLQQPSPDNYQLNVR